MALFQVRKPRPTRETAHRFFTDGIYDSGPYSTDQERYEFCENLSNKLQTIIKENFPKTANLEYAILKTHIIVEYAIEQYIIGSSNFVSDGLKGKFTFANKLEVAFMMGFAVNSPSVVPAIEMLNKIRNQAAHTFSINRSEVDEMLRILSEDYDNFSMKDDKMRIRRLRQFCVYICARISGELHAKVYIISQAIEKYRAA